MKQLVFVVAPAGMLIGESDLGISMRDGEAVTDPSLVVEHPGMYAKHAFLTAQGIVGVETITMLPVKALRFESRTIAWALVNDATARRSYEEARAKQAGIEMPKGGDGRMK